MAVVGLVVFCAVACSGHLSNDDGTGGEGGSGKPDLGGGGVGGKPSFAGGGASAAGRSGAQNVGGYPDYPGGVGGLPSFAGGGDPLAGSGGDRYSPPNPCEWPGSCAGSPGNFAGAPGDYAGAGGSVDTSPGECDSGKGCLVAQGSEIRGLAADVSDLYWVDHGTFDNLGNYDNDGQLLKRALVSGTSTVLANGLAGPAGVGLTTTHVFVYLDQVWDGKPRYSLARIPRAGGATEIVQLDAAPNGPSGGDCLGCLVNAGDTLYFPLPTGVYKIAAQDTQPTLFSSLRASSLAISGEYLYLVSATPKAIWRVPLAGGAAEQLSADPRLNIQVAGGYVYSLDNGGNKAYLARMAATGGPWVRLPKARSYSAEQLQITGDWFFHELYSDAGQQFVAGRLSDTASAGVPLTLANWTNVRWVGTAQGIFWTSGSVIRQRFNAE